MLSNCPLHCMCMKFSIDTRKHNESCQCAIWFVHVKRIRWPAPESHGTMVAGHVAIKVGYAKCMWSHTTEQIHEHRVGSMQYNNWCVYTPSTEIATKADTGQIRDSLMDISAVCARHGRIGRLTSFAVVCMIVTSNVGCKHTVCGHYTIYQVSSACLSKCLCKWKWPHLLVYLNNVSVCTKFNVVPTSIRPTTRNSFPKIWKLTICLSFFYQSNLLWTLSIVG